jgi:hypothetical protein
MVLRYVDPIETSWPFERLLLMFPSTASISHSSSRHISKNEVAEITF